MTVPSAVLGLDVGGSKTRAVLSRGGVVTGEVTVGGANLTSGGADAAQRAIDDVVTALGLDAAAVAAVCAGAAGADSAEALTGFEQLIRRRFPAAEVTVVHDTRIVLAAAGLQTGAVCIAGTGSACWGRREDGVEARAGGWGYLLADTGSGYAVARDAVQQALREVDTAQESSVLSTRLAQACGVDQPWQLLRAFYLTQDRSYWAQRAAVVFTVADEGDVAAQRIVAVAADALVDLLTVVLDRLGLPGPVVLAGGLLVHQRLLADEVGRRLAARGVADVGVLDVEPVRGALRLAEALVDRPRQVAAS
ncbi:MAG: BadF/BadG/BcrA/BcrD ATPase family protein [Actinomycetota bacterium]